MRIKFQENFLIFLVVLFGLFSFGAGVFAACPPEGPIWYGCSAWHTIGCGPADPVTGKCQCDYACDACAGECEGGSCGGWSGMECCAEGTECPAPPPPPPPARPCGDCIPEGCGFSAFSPERKFAGKTENTNLQEVFSRGAKEWKESTVELRNNEKTNPEEPLAKAERPSRLSNILEREFLPASIFRLVLGWLQEFFPIF